MLYYPGDTANKSYGQPKELNVTTPFIVSLHNCKETRENTCLFK